jgi:hypothetical protein
MGGDELEKLLNVVAARSGDAQRVDPGSLGVNRLTTLLLISVLGLVRFDPRTDSRSGAIS